MSDLINRQAALAKIRTRLQDWVAYGNEEYRRGLYACEDMIVSLPSAEAPTVSEKHQLSEETSTNTPTDLISRQDAIDAFTTDGTRMERLGLTTMTIAEAKQKAVDLLDTLPSAEPEYQYSKAYVEQLRGERDFLQEMVNNMADRPQTDCTDFINWLRDTVLNEQGWELNAVGMGEVICRKLTRLGAMECRDGFYYSADRPTDCTGCKFVGSYDTEYPCVYCERKTKDYYCGEE